MSRRRVKLLTRTAPVCARPSNCNVQSALDAIDTVRHRRALLRAIGMFLGEFRREPDRPPERLVLVDGHRVTARNEVVDQLVYEISAAAARETDLLKGFLAMELAADRPGKVDHAPAEATRLHR